MSIKKAARELLDNLPRAEGFETLDYLLDALELFAEALAEDEPSIVCGECGAEDRRLPRCEHFAEDEPEEVVEPVRVTVGMMRRAFRSTPPMSMQSSHITYTEGVTEALNAELAKGGTHEDEPEEVVEPVRFTAQMLRNACHLGGWEYNDYDCLADFTGFLNAELDAARAAREGGV